MSRKIIGAAVGTPINPQEVLERTDINKKLNTKADAFVGETSGEAVLITDGIVNTPLKKLIVYGKCKQNAKGTMASPQQIYGVENADVKLMGGNLFDLVDYVSRANINGASISGAQIYFSAGVDFIQAKIGKYIGFDGQEGVQYTLSADLRCAGATNLGLAFVYSDGTTSATEQRSDTTWYHVSATSEEGKTVVGFGAVFGLGSTASIRNFVLNVGTKEIAYEPVFVPQTINIPYKLFAIGDKKDYVDFENGRLVKHCKEIMLDGNANWSVHGGGDFFAGFLVQDAFPEGTSDLYNDGLCNQFEVSATGGLVENGLWINAVSIICIKNSYYDASASDKGLANFKAHLNKNPLQVVTYLTEPIITQLTTEEIEAYRQLYMYYPATSIIGDGVKEVGYMLDAQTYVENKIKKLESAIAQLL